MWFWYGLLTAILSALSVILNKKALNKISAPLVTWSLFVIPIPFLIPFALKGGMPDFNQIAVAAAITSSAVFALSKAMTLDSMKKGFLSAIYPLNSFGTLFTYFFGLILLSEHITIISIIGMILIIFGSYILRIDEAKEDIFKPFRLLFTNKLSFVFLLGTIIGSSSGIFDKLALLNLTPTNPALLLLFENIIMTILLTGYMIKSDRNWLNDLKNNAAILTVGGIVYGLLALVFLYGSLVGAVVLVGGVKKLEAIFVLLLSYFIFKDKPSRFTWIGTIIMLIGVILIKIG